VRMYDEYLHEIVCLFEHARFEPSTTRTLGCKLHHGKQSPLAEIIALRFDEASDCCEERIGFVSCDGVRAVFKSHPCGVFVRERCNQILRT
jgi:hypothetical protein